MANRPKRKALEDITNKFNFTPIETLRKQVESSSSNGKPLTSSLRSNSSSTTLKICSDSENRSETSIASSNISTNRSSGRTVRFQTPPRKISKSNAGTKNVAGNRRTNIEKSKETKAGIVSVSSTPVEKKKDKGNDIAISKVTKAGIMNVSSTPVEKRKNKGMPIAISKEIEAGIVSVSSTPVEKKKDKGNTIAISKVTKAGIMNVSSTPVEKRKNKGMPIAISKEIEAGVVSASSAPAAKRKDKGNAIALSKQIEDGVVSVSSTPVEKSKDKGKAIAVELSPVHFTKSSSSEHAFGDPCCSRSAANRFRRLNVSLFGGPGEKGKEVGKGNLNPSNCSYEKTEKVNESLISSGCSVENTENIDKGTDKYFSCSMGNTVNEKKSILNRRDSSIEISREKTKEKRKALSLSISLDKKSKDKEEAILHSPDIVEVPEDFSCAVKYSRPKVKSERSKNGAGASSCLPMLRSKNLPSTFDEAGDRKAWTDPYPKPRKKRCFKSESPVELPQDFIQEQKAYFEEVDAEVLQEEEVSADELD